MRRVVVTGMGLVTPLGIGLERNWSSLVEGASGVRAIQSFDVSDLPVKIAAQVPRGETASGLFNADDWVPPKDQRKMDGFIVYALAAAAQAVEDAGWTPRRRGGARAHRRHDRLRHRRATRDHRRRADLARARSAPAVAIFHSRPI